MNRKTIFPVIFLLCMSILGNLTATEEYYLYYYPKTLIGQYIFTDDTQNRVDAHGFNSPSGIAIDTNITPHHLYVADTANQRVLCWINIDEAFNGSDADLVLGQPIFFTHDPNPFGVQIDSMDGPTGLFVGYNGDLYVCDTYNNRVLVFRPPFQEGVLPYTVIGQASFDEGLANMGGSTSDKGFYLPRGVLVDAFLNLFVADSFNNRILYFKNPFGTGAGEDNIADGVLGQVSFNVGLINQGQAYPLANSLNDPWTMRLDPEGKLWVTDQYNNRLLRFPPPYDTMGMTSQLLRAQPDFNSDFYNWDGSNYNSNANPYPTGLDHPSGLLFDSAGRLYVSDYYNNRLLRWDDPTSSGMNADFVFGQNGNFYTGAPGYPKSAKTLDYPADMNMDALGRLYVVDTYNNRVLRYDNPLVSDVADAVCGQGNFSSYETNSLDGACVTMPADVATDTFDSPHHLYVADQSNHRVLCWNNIEDAFSGSPADIILGQPDMYTNTSGCSNTKMNTPSAVEVDPSSKLWVADLANNRVLGYKNPFTDDQFPDYLIGQTAWNEGNSNQGNAIPSTSTLSYPQGLAADPTTGLWVADSGNNRVLQFSSPYVIGGNSDLVLGQPDMTSFSPNDPSLGPDTFWSPTDVDMDSDGHLFVCDSMNNRVLVFSNPTGDGDADRVFGQLDDLYTNDADVGSTVSADGLNSPISLHVSPNGTLFVSDSGNSRMLGYYFAANPTCDTTADLLYGQSGDFTAGGIRSPGDLPSALILKDPAGMATDDVNRLFLADSEFNRILVFDLSPNPTAFRAIYNDTNDNSTVDQFDKIIMIFTEPIKIKDLAELEGEDFNLPHAGDSLGTGFDAWISETRHNHLVISLGAGPSLVISGMGPGASSIDITQDAGKKIFSEISDIPAIPSEPKDIQYTFLPPPPEYFGPGGGTFELPDDPDAIYTRHRIYLPPGAIPGSRIFAITPADLDLPYNTAVEIYADTAAELTLEFLPDDVDTGSGYMLKYMRIARLVEVSPGVWAPEWRNVPVTVDLVNNTVTIQLEDLYGAGGRGGKTHYGIDGDVIILDARDLVEENSINVESGGGGGLKKFAMKDGSPAVLQPGTDCIYLNHKISISGYEIVGSGGYELTIRQALSGERNGFPSQSGAVFVLESSPFFPDSVSCDITAQYVPNNDPDLTDVVTLDGTAGSAGKLRLARKNEGSGVFEFVTGYSELILNDNFTLTTKGVTNLTGSSGTAIYGLAVDPAAQSLTTAASAWELYE